MRNTYRGYTTQVQKEINAINEREEIEAIVNASFSNDETRAFNTLLICVCSVIVVIPSLLLSI